MMLCDPTWFGEHCAANVFCDADPVKVVILINGTEHRVSDCQLSASSVHPHCRVTKSRLNSQGNLRLPEGAGAWCFNDLTTNEWIQVMH